MGLLEGRMLYHQAPGSAPVDSPIQTEVTASQWLAEAALWSMWVHLGSAEATAASITLHISAEDLQKRLAKDTAIGPIISEFANQFHSRVVSACPPGARWPTDLAVPYCTFTDILSIMAEPVQVAIGSLLLETTRLKRPA